MEKNHSHHHDLHTEEAHTHDKHAGHHTSDFKKKFIISLFLTLPLVVLSAAIQDIFNYQLVFPGTDFVQLLFASVLYFYCGLPFLKGAISEVRDHAIGMMSLISVAISVAYFYSVATVFGFPWYGFLLGIRYADFNHVTRTLAGDAFYYGGFKSAQCTSRTHP
ncbi:hypothetical protein [Listeria fleischmannii]|uniref:Copper-exporting ATPase n=1 Tax=Listeria fleischmannii FSL S10-1203 TaxID=1265822 RepID=W7DMT4_9LIST|nr:hypothetical protein [Listeria fleischmannii]EUJ58810.1 copper-exporting ATPase [Listeria fleischmannii FSL S10-1203]